MLCLNFLQKRISIFKWRTQTSVNTGLMNDETEFIHKHHNWQWDFWKGQCLFWCYNLFMSSSVILHCFKKVMEYAFISYSLLLHRVPHVPLWSSLISAHRINVTSMFIDCWTIHYILKCTGVSGLTMDSYAKLSWLFHLNFRMEY